jgi:phage terminase small subunit
MAASKLNIKLYCEFYELFLNLKNHAAKGIFQLKFKRGKKNPTTFYRGCAFTLDTAKNHVYR